MDLCYFGHFLSFQRYFSSLLFVFFFIFLVYGFSEKFSTPSPLERNDQNKLVKCACVSVILSLCIYDIFFFYLRPRPNVEFFMRRTKL